MSDLLSQLILTDLQIANLDVGAIIAIDTPTVLLNAIDAVGIAANIIDVHHTDTVVGVGCSSREFHFLHVNKGFVNSNSIYCLFKFLAAKIANPLLTTEKNSFFTWQLCYMQRFYSISFIYMTSVLQGVRIISTSWNNGRKQFFQVPTRFRRAYKG